MQTAPETIRVVNLGEKLDQFTEFWSPKIVGEVNDTLVKLVKFRGEFVWHKHDREDELFLVMRGTLIIRLRERDLTIRPGEFVVIPRGVEHCPVAEDEVHVVLIEPKTTLNTGDVRNERTLEHLERL
jgi:mannose-6-phosphate isomerase-like protein (cupin superfamily)